MKVKSIISAAIILLIILWSVRIYKVNSKVSSETWYGIGDTIECGDITIQAYGSGIDKVDIFCRDNGIDPEEVDSADCYIVYVGLRIANRSQKDISRNELIEFINWGFESDIWGSAADPVLTDLLNDTGTGSVAPGESFELKLATEINASLFRPEHFEKIKEYDYYYILRIYPDKIGIKLDV